MNIEERSNSLALLSYDTIRVESYRAKDNFIFCIKLFKVIPISTIYYIILNLQFVADIGSNEYRFQLIYT